MFIEDLRDVLLLLLGWLLGLLAPIIVSYFQEKRQVASLESALLNELRELQYRLVLLVYRIESKYDEINHEFFQRAQSILTEYKGINTVKSLLDTIGPLLKLTKDEMAIYSQMTKNSNLPNSGLGLKKHSLSLLESNIALLTKLDPILRGRLLEIKTRIGYVNETVDEANYYFHLSFQNGISTDNYKIANTNMIGSYKMYATQARRVVEIIKEIMVRKSEP